MSQASSLLKRPFKEKDIQDIQMIFFNILTWQKYFQICHFNIGRLWRYFIAGRVRHEVRKLGFTSWSHWEVLSKLASKNYQSFLFERVWSGGEGPWLFLSGDPITWNKGGWVMLEVAAEEYFSRSNSLEGQIWGSNQSVVEFYAGK